MAERVAQFAAFVDRSRRCRRDVARYAAREGKLLEKLLQPGLIPRDIGIDLAPRALQIHIADDGRAAMAGTGDVEHVQVVGLDDAVQVDVDEVLARRRPPVADH